MGLDIAAAEGAYRRALGMARDGQERAAVLVKLADALQEQGRLPEAEQAYEDALPALSEAGDERMSALAKLGLARALWRHGDTGRARELTYDGVAMLERDPGPDLVGAYERAAVIDATRRAVARRAWPGPRRRSPLRARWASRTSPQPPDAWPGTHQSRRPRGGLDDMREALALSFGSASGSRRRSYLNLGEMVAPFESLAAGLELIDASLEFAAPRD